MDSVSVLCSLKFLKIFTRDTSAAGSEFAAVMENLNNGTISFEYRSNTGGAVMGDDPSTSVVNKYGQSWDVPNVFVFGAALFPQNHGYNPTGTVGAQAYLGADGIVNQYIKSPGALLHV